MRAKGVRVTVEVVVEISREGLVTPLYIKYRDGKYYKISKILDEQQMSWRTRGYSVKRYNVIINGQQRFLYREDHQEPVLSIWFVETKNYNPLTQSILPSGKTASEEEKKKAAEEFVPPNEVSYGYRTCPICGRQTLFFSVEADGSYTISCMPCDFHYLHKSDESENSEKPKQYIDL